MEMGEVAFKGRRWTWANNRKGEGYIEERLDMFFGSAAWFVDFDRSEVQHIPNQSSDHSIIILDTKANKQKPKAIFIFDGRWSKMSGCSDVILYCWNQEVEGSRMYKFHKRLQNCRKGLVEWRKKGNTNAKVQIDNIMREMNCMQELGGQRDWDEWFKLKSQLEEAYKAEEEFWARKSRVE